MSNKLNSSAIGASFFQAVGVISVILVTARCKTAAETKGKENGLDARSELLSRARSRFRFAVFYAALHLMERLEETTLCAKRISPENCNNLSWEL